MKFELQKININFLRQSILTYFFNFYLEKLQTIQFFFSYTLLLITTANSSDLDSKYFYYQPIPSHYYFTVVTLLFITGLFGLLFSSRNFLLFLIKVEMMFIGINLGFIGLATYTLELDGYAYSLILLGMLAAETVLGLSLFIFVFFMRQDDVMKEVIMFESDLLKTEEELEKEREQDKSLEARAKALMSGEYTFTEVSNQCEDNVELAEIYAELCEQKNRPKI